MRSATAAAGFMVECLANSSMSPGGPAVDAGMVPHIRAMPVVLSWLKVVRMGPVAVLPAAPYRDMPSLRPFRPDILAYATTRWMPIVTVRTGFV